MQLEDLQKFCSTDETRFALLSPFKAGDYTAATDGKIMVRIPFIGGIVENDEFKTVSPEVIENNIPKKEGIPVEYPSGWETWEPIKETCEQCKGGGAFVDCEKCDGFGETECDHCGHEGDCHDCNGKGGFARKIEEYGDHACLYCHGTGDIKKIHPVSLNKGDMHVDLPYLKKIHTLPNVQAFICREPGLSLIHFKFDGGEGVLMPLREERREFTRAQWPAEAKEGATP